MFQHTWIDDAVWQTRLQDSGCEAKDLRKATYRQNKIPPYGPPDALVYYPDLSATAIDYVKSINTLKANGIRWSTFPKNISDTKIKILKVLLSLRKMNGDGVFELQQDRFISLLESQWGTALSSDNVEDNDKVRLFGLLFLDRNADKLHRLLMGVSNRSQLEDPNLVLKGLFELLALEFNNNEIVIPLPEKSCDLNNDELIGLDPNDGTRMRISRDGKWVEKLYRTVLVEYKAILKQWYLGTGGGSGRATMFEDWSSEKLNKYDIDPSVYDHTDIKNRPAVLIDS